MKPDLSSMLMRVNICFLPLWSGTIMEKWIAAFTVSSLSEYTGFSIVILLIGAIHVATLSWSVKCSQCISISNLKPNEELWPLFFIWDFMFQMTWTSWTKKHLNSSLWLALLPLGRCLLKFHWTGRISRAALRAHKAEGLPRCLQPLSGKR